MKAINSHLGAWAPMAEQHAVSKYLQQQDAVEAYFKQFKASLEMRLNGFYDGFQQLKQAGFSVDAIVPQAAIYLTVQIDLVGKAVQDGTVLVNQTAVTAYLLDEAGLAIVPFSAFGASINSSWYRLSVGTSKIEEISQMLAKLKVALEKLQ